MHLPYRAAILLLLVATAGCAPQIVAPFNPELQQKASAMQAEAGAWDLKMLKAAGTAAADPRHPEVVTVLSKWRGEADAMRTLALSNDPGVVNCGAAVKAVQEAIESRLPANLRPSAQPASTPAPAPAGATGCQTELVMQIDDGIESIEEALRFCTVPWINDAYFIELTQNPATAPKPAAASSQAVQDQLTRACQSEFRPNPRSPAKAGAANHGRAVSGLLTTLQAIVYIENRKKAVLAPKPGL